MICDDRNWFLWYIMPESCCGMRLKFSNEWARDLSTLPDPLSPHLFLRHTLEHWGQLLCPHFWEPSRVTDLFYQDLKTCLDLLLSLRINQDTSVTNGQFKTILHLWWAKVLGTATIIKIWGGKNGDWDWHITLLRCVCTVTSVVWLFATPRTVAHQAPLSMGLPRQEYWRGLPHPPPADLLDPGIEPTSLMHPALASGLFTHWATWEAHILLLLCIRQTAYENLLYSTGNSTQCSAVT